MRRGDDDAAGPAPPPPDAEIGPPETRYRSLVEHLPAVVYILANDEGQTTTYLSPQFESLTGYSPAEALEQARREPWLNFVHPEDRERVAALATHSVALSEPFRSEHRLLRRDGSYVWVRDECLPIFDTTGQLIAWQGIYIDISDLKTVEQALAVSETRFRTAFENAPIGIALVDPEGSFLRGNRALCTMLGMSEEQLLQTTFQQITHPDDLGPDLVQTRRAVAGEISTFTLEKRYIRRDGQTIWVRIVTSLLRDERGAPRYFITQIEDVTAKRDAAEALARERELMHTLMDHLPDAIYVKDIDSRFLRLNPATAVILGIEDPSQALGKTDFDFFPESLARQFFADEQHVITSGQSLLNRLEPQQEGETAAWWLTSTVPVRDATGAVVGIVGAGRDITERLRTEAALQASETRQRALLAALPDLMFCLDRSGTFLDYKADRLDDLLIPPQQFLGRTVVEVLSTNVAALVMRTITRVLDTGGMEIEEYALDTESEQVFFEARFVAAGPDEVVVIVRNVTERARAEAELRAAKEAAEKANHLKSAFLSTMSHEVRTPLTSIVGYTDLLLGNPALSSDFAEDLDHIARSSRHLLALVNDLLDLSRIEAGAMPLRIERVPLTEVVAEALALLAPQIASKGLAVENCVPAHLMVAADRQRLRQILLNQIGNAIKFTRVGMVAINAQRTADQIQIAVTDTGIGIPAAALPRIFDEFRQADSSTTRRFGGAGLGLAIAKQLAELHGGHVSVFSDVGTGSTFTVHLPAG
jgi:two-component system sensor histidine kinase/response regulator